MCVIVTTIVSQVVGGSLQECPTQGRIRRSLAQGRLRDCHNSVVSQVVGGSLQECPALGRNEMADAHCQPKIT